MRGLFAGIGWLGRRYRSTKRAWQDFGNAHPVLSIFMAYAAAIIVVSVGVAGLVAYQGSQLPGSPAERAKLSYPEYYSCREYPKGDKLRPADLVPTANVIVNFSYSQETHAYVVTADPMVTVSGGQETVYGDSQETMFVAQTFTLDFAPGVRYFRTYKAANADGHTWNGTRALYNPTSKLYTITFSAKHDGRDAPVTIIATDTITCSPGAVGLPAGFDWSQIATTDAYVPEYYTTRVGHPQG